MQNSPSHDEKHNFPHFGCLKDAIAHIKEQKKKKESRLAHIDFLKRENERLERKLHYAQRGVNLCEVEALQTQNRKLIAQKDQLVKRNVLLANKTSELEIMQQEANKNGKQQRH